MSNSINNNKALMTHIVLGYPNFEANKKLIKVMADAGTDYIEMQIPFSDPIADGPTIVNANQKALISGTSLSDCIKFAGEMAAAFKEINFLFMTYYNIIFSTGISKFINDVKKKNLYGLIVPDIPFDEDKEGFFQECRNNSINPVYVFSPGTTDERLKKIGSVASGFVYCTSRVGITGAGKDPHQKLNSYITNAKKIVNLPVAVGFGIDNAAKAKKIAEFADIIVIGSKVLNIVDEAGRNFQKPAFKFLSDIKKSLS
ncbi:MAG: tryptophan synthase subunit alpha [Spirochaetes bacterium]|nr:tryptophan synthase subunit alpha [Spirochaetota bacterium]